MTKTWVLVADSSRAKLFTADKPLAPLHEIESFTHPESRAKTQDLTSDRPGRSLDNKSFMDYETEPKRQEAVVFARQLGEHLREGRTKGLYGKLYVVAPPQFLGILRDKLDGQTSELIAGELSKDLTQLKADEIRRHLPERL